MSSMTECKRYRPRSQAAPSGGCMPTARKDETEDRSGLAARAPSTRRAAPPAEDAHGAYR